MRIAAESLPRPAWPLLCLLSSFLSFVPVSSAQAPPEANPYVFVVLDTSGSMNWTPACNHLDAAADVDPFDGACTTACPAGDANCARICPSYGCIEYQPTAELPDSIEPIVVDNNDPAPAFTSSAAPLQRQSALCFDPAADTFADPGGTLPESPTPDPATDAAYYVPTTRANRFTFTPTLDHAGLWHVYAYWPVVSTNSKSTRFEINYFDGAVMRTKLLEVDQLRSPSPAAFTFLATVDFRANGGLIPASVVIRNTNDNNQIALTGEIVADAIAFVPVPLAPKTASCLASGYVCRQPLCPQGNCFAPMGGDDPTSKFYQVKKALHEAIGATDSIQYGFGTFDQDNARVLFKHWRYQVSPGTTPIFNFPDGTGATLPFPAPGRIDTFGTGAPYGSNGRTTSDNNGFHCASSTITDPTSSSFNDANFIGCMSNYPADLRDLWEMDRLSLIPKLGKAGNAETWLYVRAWTGTAYQVYRLDWELYSPSQKLGSSTFTAQLDITRCNNLTSDPTCSNSAYSTQLVSNAPITYQLLGENIPFHLSIGRYPQVGEGFFHNQLGAQSERTCDGLEPNPDWDLTSTSPSTDDTWNSYAFKYPPLADSRGDYRPDGITPMSFHATYFDTGDFLPLDWLTDRRDQILTRLAPNQVANPADLPDFRTASYFHDEVLYLDWPSTLDRKLRLRDDVIETSPGVWGPRSSPITEPKRRPLLASGLTPIYRSVRNFKDWYVSWKNYARLQDPDWALRPKYLLYLSDGDETCDTGSPLPICATYNDVRELASGFVEDRVKTFTVGYGLWPVASAALTCMAADGGTGPGGSAASPYFARNAEELKAALDEILYRIRTGTGF